MLYTDDKDVCIIALSNLSDMALVVFTKYIDSSQIM